MYLEKLLTAHAVTLVLILAFAASALLYIRAKAECLRKDRQLKILERKLEKLTRKLENTTVMKNSVLNYDKSKTEFFTSMTHELKTPISVILGAIQLLSLKVGSQAEENPFLSKNMKIIRSNCFRLLRLINNILDFSRADSGYLRFSPVNCNLVQALEEIVQSVQPYAQQKQLSLDYQKNTDEIFTAIDLEKLERIMLNLLSNAIKFTPAGGSILVSVGLSGQNAAISVRDTGIGIPPEKQKCLFQKFEQVGSIQSKENEGSGIGLWLVKAFVELQGGSISLSSEYGKGSEFTVLLPVTALEDCGEGRNEQSLFRDNLLQAADMEFMNLSSTNNL